MVICIDELMLGRLIVKCFMIAMFAWVFWWVLGLLKAPLWMEFFLSLVAGVAAIVMLIIIFIRLCLA